MMKGLYTSITLAGLIGLALVGVARVSAGPQAAAPMVESTSETVTLKIEGWTCASCEKDIRHALLAVPGVTKADVSYARGGAVVEIEGGRVRGEQLVQAVAQSSNPFSSYRAIVVPNGTLVVEAHKDSWGSWLKSLLP